MTQGSANELDPSEMRLITACLIVLVLLFAGLLFWLARRQATKKPKLALLADEKRVADIFVETKQISWGGMTLFGSPWEGKLILTTDRLIYANPNEQKTGFAVSRDAITKIEKGTSGALMTLELEYMPPNAKKPKQARFIQVGGVGGMLQYVDGSKQMPMGMFIDKLLTWKQAA